jgi:hypothetical protein
MKKKAMEVAADAGKPDMAAPAPNMGKGGYKKADVEVEVGDDEDEDEEEMEMAKKSVDLTGDDLAKSLRKLHQLVESSDEVSRKDALLSKAQNGADLSKSERDELFSLLGGGEKKQDSVSAQLVKGLQDNSHIKDALDVSNYLSESHSELCKSLSSLGDYVSKSDARQHEFNLVLAKAVADVGNLVKSVAETVGAIAQAPARAPKSAGVRGAVLEKSFAGAAPAGDQLSKAQILDTLESMMEKSMSDGSDGRSAGGHDLLMSIAKYESGNAIAPGLLAEVKQYRAQRSAH